MASTRCFHCDQVKPIYDEVFCERCYHELVDAPERPEQDEQQAAQHETGP